MDNNANEILRLAQLLVEFTDKKSHLYDGFINSINELISDMVSINVIEYQDRHSDMECELSDNPHYKNLPTLE